MANTIDDLNNDFLNNVPSFMTV